MNNNEYFSYSINGIDEYHRDASQVLTDSKFFEDAANLFERKDYVLLGKEELSGLHGLKEYINYYSLNTKDECEYYFFFTFQWNEDAEQLSLHYLGYEKNVCSKEVEDIEGESVTFYQFEQFERDYRKYIKPECPLNLENLKYDLKQNLDRISNMPGDVVNERCIYSFGRDDSSDNREHDFEFILIDDLGELAVNYLFHDQGNIALSGY